MNTFYIEKYFVKKHLPLERRMEFYESLSQYASDKQSLMAFFRNKANRAKKKKIPHGHVYIAIQERLSSGKSIMESIKPFIPKDELVYLVLADRISRMSEMLTGLVKMVRAKNEIATGFRVAAIMPSLVILIGIVLGGVLTYVLAPTIRELVGDSPVTGFPGFVVNKMSVFLFYGYPFLVVGLLLSVAVIIALLPQIKTSAIRNFLDKWWVFSQYKEYASSSLLSSMAAALDGGLSMRVYFTLQFDNSTPYIKSISKKILYRLGDGHYTDQESIDVGFFNNNDMEQIYDYSSSFSSSAAIIRISERAGNKAVSRIKSSFSQMTFILVVAVISFLACYAGGLIFAAMEMSTLVTQ